MISTSEATIDVEVNVPTTCNLDEGEDVPMPTLPENSARETVPSALTSMLGMPEISLTLKIVPVKSSVMLNN
jgi:hypothetical protein